MKYAIGIIGIALFRVLDWMDTFCMIALLFVWGLAIVWGNLFKADRRKLI